MPSVRQASQRLSSTSPQIMMSITELMLAA
jgi:hypothetical protein